MQTRPDEAREKAAGEQSVGERSGAKLPIVHRSLKERMEEYGGKLNLSPEIERDEPVGREIW